MSEECGSESVGRVRQTLMLAVMMVLVPMLLGVAFVWVYKTVPVARQPQQDAAEIALTNRLHHAAQLSLRELQLLHRDARQAGYNTEEVDVRIWAASVQNPPVLMSVPPPGADDTWAWTLSSDGAYAVAMGARLDAAGRKTVGLYDLKTDEWVWTNKFVWPDTYEMPHVFNRTFILRYVKNNAKFAMEIDPAGKIKAINPLANSTFELARPPAAIPGCPGQPVALKHNVFFTAAPGTGNLTGYAHCRLPGLYPAGEGDANTRFSGNGRLKFKVDNGKVVIEDSLTQIVLQQFSNAWKTSANTELSGVAATRDGGQLTLYMKTTFEERGAVTARDWSTTIDVIEAKSKTSFGADATPPKQPYPPTQARSRDGRWVFSVARDNEMVIATQGEPARVMARVPLGKLLDLPKPISYLTALEEGRYLVIRCDADFWLLDLSVIRNYASQLERMAVSEAALANPDKQEEEEEQEEDYGIWIMPPPLPIAPIALRGEQMYQHQAWFYAVARFATCMKNAAMDSRAPRINPLLYARASFLSQQPALGKAICRSALQALPYDYTDYNRMIRYHLQELYFADAK